SIFAAARARDFVLVNSGVWFWPAPCPVARRFDPAGRYARLAGRSAVSLARKRMIEPPYLLFLGDAPDALAAKVAQGIRDWRPDLAIGQFRLEGCKADLGLPDMT